MYGELLGVLVGCSVVLLALAAVFGAARRAVVSLDRLRVQVRRFRVRARRDGWGGETSDRGRTLPR